MKKYTLKVRALNTSVTADCLRMATENILLHLHPRITYRLGQVTQMGSNSFFVEMASDGEKAFLEAHLIGIQDKLPVAIENLGWGWIANDMMNLPNHHNLQQLPLITGESEIVPRSFSSNSKTLLFRYILLISLTFVLIALLIARFYLDKLFILDYAYYAVFLAWLFSLNETPLDIRLYVQKIDCELAKLVVTYMLWKKTIQMNWETIWGLEYKNGMYTIYRSNSKPIRFLIQNNLKDTDALLIAITQRASLNNVESGISKVVYKRYEAP